LNNAGISAIQKQLARWKSFLDRLEQKFRLMTFVHTLLPSFAALGLQFVTFIVTARALGVEQFGIYTGILAIAAIGAEVVGLGGADILVRAVARDKTKFRAYFGNMLIYLLWTMPFVTAIALYFAIGLMHIHLTILVAGVAILMEMLIARSSASLELVMVAHGHTVKAGYIRMLTVVVRLLTVLVFSILYVNHALNDWIALVSIQSFLLSFCYGLIAAKGYGSPIWKMLKNEAGDGLAFCVNQTARSAQTNLDRVVLARYADDAMLGLYGAATRILQLGLFPIQVATRIIYPKFFVHGEKGIAHSHQFALKVAPMLMLVGIFSGACVALAAFFAPVVLGKDYAGITHVALWLSLAMPFIALQYPAADALTGAGKQWLRARIYGVMALTFALLLLIGAHMAGVNGLIAAFVSGHVIFAAVLWASVLLALDK
jgi:O-antigen/teichoic acid export membrane protein